MKPNMATRYCAWCGKVATGTANAPDGRWPSCGDHHPSRYHATFQFWSLGDGCFGSHDPENRWACVERVVPDA